MKKERYKTYASPANGEGEISAETCTTRLFVEDLSEVKALCVDGKTKSDVIRELVRRALYSRRYRQATKDPAFRELLKAFDDQMSVRLHLLEERLTGRMEADHSLSLALTGYIYFAVYFGMHELRTVQLQVTPESVSEEEYMKAWDERFEATRKQVSESFKPLLERRRKQIEAARGQSSE